MSEQIVESILQQTDACWNLEEKVEVLANVLMAIGCQYIDPLVIITPENVIEVVMKDKQQNGEKLHNALALQGLQMLLWLRKE